MAFGYGGERDLQRKLIPLNIFVCIIALIAAVTLLFTPLMTIDLGKFAEIAANELEADAGDGQSADGDSGESADLDVTGMLKNINLKIVISPMSAAKVARAPQDKKAETLFGDFFIGTKLIDTLMINMVNFMFVESIDGVDVEDVTDLTETLQKLDNVKSKAEFDAVINEYLDKVEQLGGATIVAEERADFIEHCDEIYDKTVSEVDKFSLEAMICVAVSSGLIEDGENEGETSSAPQKVLTSYEELISEILKGDGEDMGEIGESLAEIKDLINQIAGIYGYLFYAVLFFAGMWLILFLFSFLHIFAKNKRFMMWYVKLTGYIPCLIFGVLPVVLKQVLARVIEGDAGRIIGAAMSAFSTMTWISGVCYLLLWLVSIFWAFPIKRKIRRMK